MKNQIEVAATNGFGGGTFTIKYIILFVSLRRGGGGTILPRPQISASHTRCS